MTTGTRRLIDRIIEAQFVAYPAQAGLPPVADASPPQWRSRSPRKRITIAADQHFGECLHWHT